MAEERKLWDQVESAALAGPLILRGLAAALVRYEVNAVHCLVREVILEWREGFNAQEPFA